LKIRVVLPHHLQTLAATSREVSVRCESDRATSAKVLDALEAQYPELRGTIREHGSLKRRPRVRFFAAGRDISHDPPDTELPASIAEGREAFMIVGAIAGG